MTNEETWVRELAARWSEQLPPARTGEFNLIAALADDPDNGMLELAPGVWIVDRLGWGANG